MSYLTPRGVKDQPPVIETLFENTSVKIDRITAQGQITPLREFPKEPSYEFIHLLKGQLVLEYGGEAEKVSLKPGEYAIKTPQQSTRADYTALHEDTVYLKVSHKGKPGNYPEFTGAVCKENALGYLATRRVRSQPPVIETLFENTVLKIDRVTAHGQITPPGVFPSEPSHEFIHMLRGQMVLEYKGEAEKVNLKPGDYAIKTPDQSTRADFTSIHDETVYLKVSYGGKRGRYPEFTGAVGPDEVHQK